MENINEEIWRDNVNNAVHDLQTDIQKIRKYFEHVTGQGGTLLHDKTTIAERQLRIVEIEVKNLVSVIGKVSI